MNRKRSRPLFILHPSAFTLLPMPVLLVGTFDTKGPEFAFVRELLVGLGLKTLTIDAGSQGPPTFAPDVGRERVFGKSIPTERGQAVAAAAAGVVRIVRELHAVRQVDGILGLGGSAGASTDRRRRANCMCAVPRSACAKVRWSAYLPRVIGAGSPLRRRSVRDITAICSIPGRR